jgi:hypothetical protein
MRAQIQFLVKIYYNKPLARVFLGYVLKSITAYNYAKSNLYVVIEYSIVTGVSLRTFDNYRIPSMDITISKHISECRSYALVNLDYFNKKKIIQGGRFFL